MAHSRSAGSESDAATLEPSTATPSPTQRDYRRVGALALTSTIVLAIVGCLQLFVPPSLAPRVNIRWAEEVGDIGRAELERQLKLLAAERLEGTTWAYDLADPSPQAIEAIVTHPSVEDTHYIDRPRRTLSSETRLGTTRIRAGLSLWRDAPFIPWLVRLASSFLIVSGLWLVTTGRPALSSLGRKSRRPRNLFSTADS